MAVAKSTIATRQPDQSLKVVDTTREDVLASVNTYTQSSATAAAAKSYFGNNQLNSKSILSGITDSIKATGGGLGLDNSTLRNRLNTSLGVGDLTRGLKESLAADMLTAMGVADAKNQVSILMSGKDQYESMKSSIDFSSANSIVGAIAAITGDASLMKVIDPGGYLGIIGFVSKQLIEWGVTDAIDALLEKIKDEKALNAMLEQLALDAARASDLALCRKLCGKMGKGRAYAIRGRLLTAIVSSYELQTGDTRTYSQRADEMLELMAFINPSWTSDGARAGSIQLEYYCKATPDCITLMQSKSERKFPAALGTLYAIRDFTEINSDHFPGVTW